MLVTGQFGVDLGGVALRRVGCGPSLQECDCWARKCWLTVSLVWLLLYSEMDGRFLDTLVVEELDHSQRTGHTGQGPACWHCRPGLHMKRSAGAQELWGFVENHRCGPEAAAIRRAVLSLSSIALLGTQCTGRVRE